MNSDLLKNTLEAKKAFLQSEDVILRKALSFYNMGYSRLSSSQMAAIGALLQKATSFGEAKKDVVDFLEKQLKKLKAKEQRSGKTSWLLEVTGSGSKVSLGETLEKWISKEMYLGASLPSAVDHLATLRRFWGDVCALYRYKKAFGKGMPLREVS